MSTWYRVPLRPLSTRPFAANTVGAPPPPPPPRRKHPSPMATASPVARATPSSPLLQPPTVMTHFPAHLHNDVLSNGLLLVDKPPHWEVAEVVAAVQRATRARKVASVSPLDAAGSGLMLLCFGRATRLSARVERAAKRYEGSLVLGAAAAAADVRGGSFVSEALPWGHVTDEDLQEAAEGMVACLEVDGGDGDGGGSDRDEYDADDGGNAGGADGFITAAGVATKPAAATLRVLPPRFRLRQYPSSFGYYEEDDGPGLLATSLRLYDFKAWRASEEEIRRSAAAATAAAVTAGGKVPITAAEAIRAARRTDPRVPGTAGGGSGGGHSDPSDMSPLVGRVVRFSVTMSGRAHVRSLVAMYGRRLRTCACLDELRRTQVASFSVDDAWPLDAVLPILQRYDKR